MPLSLNDDELSALLDAAKPLAPHQRSAFLTDVAAELSATRKSGSA